MDFRFDGHVVHLRIQLTPKREPLEFQVTHWAEQGQVRDPADIPAHVEGEAINQASLRLLQQGVAGVLTRE
jgi:hypothetical protein